MGRLWERPPKKSTEPCYDLFDDWDLIVSSFLSQYGLRLSTKEFESVSWDEFRALLSGLSPDTALGRVVAIRAETDVDAIKHFTKDQRRLYDAWQERRARHMSEVQYEREMQALERFMLSQIGGDQHGG